MTEVKIGSLSFSIPEEPHEALDFVINKFHEFDRTLDREGEMKNYRLYIQFHSLLEVLSSKCLLVTPEVRGDHGPKEIVEYTQALFSHMKDTLQKKTTKEEFRTSLERFKFLLSNDNIGYTFTDGDIQTIQKKINELRGIIRDSAEFSDNHKKRLLNRLEKMQQETHKKMSDVDSFMGFMFDLSAVVKGFADSATQISEAVTNPLKVIMRIIYASQGRVAELPTGTELSYEESPADRLTGE